jgi:hypothetical protein
MRRGGQEARRWGGEEAGRRGGEEARRRGGEEAGAAASQQPVKVIEPFPEEEYPHVQPLYPQQTHQNSARDAYRQPA